ncbi:MAG: MFS transporter [Isosphaeraceae bacterium]
MNASDHAPPRSFPRTLLILALGHALVDTFAGMIQPLWPDLQRGLMLDDLAMQGAFVLWSLATSVSQLAFGYLGDRGRRHWWLWAGTAVGIVCMSMLGLANGFVSFGVLIVVGGLGIAAFHPEAAALAGSCAPGDRSRAMSLFAVGGYLGQAAGPIYSGVVSTHFGIPALAWSVPGGLVLVVLLALAMRRYPGSAAAGAAHGSSPAISLPRLLRGKGWGVGVMMTIGVLRVLPAAGVPLALAYLLKQRGVSNEQIGIAQAVYLTAIGAGNLACALSVPPSRERRVLVLLPLLSVPFLAVCPLLSFAGMLICEAAVGLSIGAVMPILIGYGQHLLRDALRVASSLTMGVTWGVGGMIVAALVGLFNHAQRPDMAFPVFAVAVAISCALCAWLPETEPAIDPDPFAPTHAPMSTPVPTRL